MRSARIVKTDPAFDDFLKDISFTDFDVEYTAGNVASDLHGKHLSVIVSAEDTAKVVFAGPIQVADPVQSPTSVDFPMSLPARKQTKATGRTSAAAQRRRNRVRNQSQRERENAMRQVKQAEFVDRRDECFHQEHALRSVLLTVISEVTREHNVSVQEAIALLPADVRNVIARAGAAMKRYRMFTGQRNICEQLNQFPAWQSEDE